MRWRGCCGDAIIAISPEEKTLKELSEEARKWLELRKIDVELAIRMGWHTKDTGELAIPYYLNGELSHCKYRKFPEKEFYQDKDPQKIPYNADVIIDPALQNEPLVITEGEFDCLVAISCGYVRSVSVPNGANATHNDTSFLDNYMVPIRNSKCVVVATDAGQPGETLRDDLVRAIGPASCKWVDYPDGTKDLNEVLYRYGKEGPNSVSEILGSSKWVAVDGVGTIKDYVVRQQRDTFDTGMGFLSGNLCIRRGDFSVVTGIPSHGKTTWVNDLCARMARQHGWRICVASFEQPTRPDHEEWLIHWYWERPLPDINPVQRNEALDWIDRHFVFIAPPGEDLNTVHDLMWLEERMATAVLRYGCQMIVIDPWNEIEHNRKRTESLTEYVGESIRSLKRFAAKYNVHLMVVAHPMKPFPNKDGSFPAPTLYSISDSAHWYNKPDVGIIVLREDNMTTIRIAKVRYQGKIGRPGDAHCWFNWHTHRFESI